MKRKVKRTLVYIVYSERFLYLHVDALNVGMKLCLLDVYSEGLYSGARKRNQVRAWSSQRGTCENIGRPSLNVYLRLHGIIRMSCCLQHLLKISRVLFFSMRQWISVCNNHLYSGPAVFSYFHFQICWWNEEYSNRKFHLVFFFTF